MRLKMWVSSCEREFLQKRRQAHERKPRDLHLIRVRVLGSKTKWLSEDQDRIKKTNVAPKTTKGTPPPPSSSVATVINGPEMMVVADSHRTAAEVGSISAEFDLIDSTPMW